MARGAVAKTSFNAGEFSPMMEGRADITRYASAAKLLQNFLPTIPGPIRRRPGTRFVAEYGFDAPVLVPFVFNREQAYVLAIGTAGIHVYTDRGIIESSPGVPYVFGSTTWTAAPRRADGSVRISWTQSGDTLYVCDPDGDLPIQVISRLSDTSWTIARWNSDIPPISDVEATSGLRIWWNVTDQKYYAYDPEQFQTAGERGVLAWVDSFVDTAEIERDYAPGMTVGANKILVVQGRWYYHTGGGALDDWTPSHTFGVKKHGAVSLEYIGNGTFYFDIVETGLSGITDVPVGKKCAQVWPRIRNTNGGELATATGAFDTEFVALRFASYAAAMITTLYALGAAHIDINPLYKWNFASVPYAYAAPTIGGPPEHIQFFRNRLVFSIGSTLFGSVAGDYFNFSRFDAEGNVVADSSFKLTIATGDVTDISWMVSADVLLLGTYSGEFVLAEQNGNEAFGPLNVKVEHYGVHGAAKNTPLRIDDDAFYISRTGKRLRRFTWDSARDGYKSIDMNAMADHIGKNPLQHMAYQTEPTSVIWVADSEGDLFGLTYDREQDVYGWHRHSLGGQVRALCAIPSPDGKFDDLWLVVEREIDGDTVFYIEVLVDEFELGAAAEDICYLDCSLTYDGAAATTISNLEHLEGETVQILADGATHADKTVASGSITLDRSASVVHVGLHHASRLQNNRLDSSADDGVGIGKTRRIHQVVARVLETVGFRAGPNFTKMDRHESRTPSNPMDEAVPAQTGDIRLSHPGGYGTDGYLCIEQDQPLPCTIIALVFEFEITSR